MKTKRGLEAQILDAIDKFNEKSSPFDSGFQFVVEAVNSVQAGIQAIEVPASSHAARSYFEQAKEYLGEAKNMLANSPGYSTELRHLMDRYLKFCDRILTEL